MGINPVQGTRAIKAAIKPLNAAASASAVEGRTILNAHVFTNTNVPYRVGTFSSHSGFAQQKLFSSTHGHSNSQGALDQIINETTRRPFGIAVKNVRHVPDGVKDVEAATRHLEDVIRANPDQPAGAVLQGRDGQLALGDLVFTGSYPKINNGSVSSSTVTGEAAQKAGNQEKVGIWIRDRSPHSEKITKMLSDSERVTFRPASISTKVVEGSMPRIQLLDLSGAPIPDDIRVVAPSVASYKAAADKEVLHKGIFGTKWKPGGKKEIQISPNSAREITVNGQPLRPNERNIAVGFERLDETVQAIVGRDGRLDFA